MTKSNIMDSLVEDDNDDDCLKRLEMDIKIFNKKTQKAVDLTSGSCCCMDEDCDNSIWCKNGTSYFEGMDDALFASNRPDKDSLCFHEDIEPWAQQISSSEMGVQCTDHYVRVVVDAEGITMNFPYTSAFHGECSCLVDSGFLKVGRVPRSENLLTKLSTLLWQ
jgi:hypothetical protein